MNSFAYRTLCVAALAALSACGEAPLGDAPSSPNLQKISFTGVVEPASGRFQLIANPQAAIGVIPEDANGNPASATNSTAQVYGATVNFALKGGTGYPTGCTGAQVMYSNVQILSGFTEQLRNVYVNMTTISGGQSFCTIATVRNASFAPAPLSTIGLYYYDPLDAGTSPSAISRSVQWAMNLPDNSAFWFKGDLWAEIIPQLPTIVRPLAAGSGSVVADGGSVSVGAGTSGNVQFRWTNDSRADGQKTGETSYPVNRPSVQGAMLTVLQCGLATSAYNSANCTTIVLPGTLYATRHTVTLLKGYWFKWTLQTVFTLPGNISKNGTLLFSRSFKTVT